MPEDDDTDELADDLRAAASADAGLAGLRSTITALEKRGWSRPRVWAYLQRYTNLYGWGLRPFAVRSSVIVDAEDRGESRDVIEAALVSAGNHRDRRKIIQEAKKDVDASCGAAAYVGVDEMGQALAKSREAMHTVMRTLETMTIHALTHREHMPLPSNVLGALDSFAIVLREAQQRIDGFFDAYPELGVHPQDRDLEPLLEWSRVRHVVGREGGRRTAVIRRACRAHALDIAA